MACFWNLSHIGYIHTTGQRQLCNTVQQLVRFVIVKPKEAFMILIRSVKLRKLFGNALAAMNVQQRFCQKCSFFRKAVPAKFV